MCNRPYRLWYVNIVAYPQEQWKTLSIKTNTEILWLRAQLIENLLIESCLGFLKDARKHLISNNIWLTRKGYVILCIPSLNMWRIQAVMLKSMKDERSFLLLFLNKCEQDLFCLVLPGRLVGFCLMSSTRLVFSHNPAKSNTGRKAHLWYLRAYQVFAEFLVVKPRLIDFDEFFQQWNAILPTL